MPEEEEETSSRRRRRRRLAALIVMRIRARRKRNTRFRDKLNAEGRRRRDRNLPRCALLPPSEAPWLRVFLSGDDGAMITVTGMDYRAFTAILRLFTPLFHAYTPWTGKKDGHTYRRVTPEKAKGRGSKRIVTPAACLGLVLAWYRFRGAEFALQGWFGFTGSHANVWLRFGRRMLIKCLVKHPLAQVKFPSDEAIAKYQEIVALRHQHLPDVYCTADGCKLHFQACKGLSEQSMFYNGWLHSHFVTNLFVFGADGRIINSLLNVPGSVHDSTLAVWGGMYRKLKEAYATTKGVCCCDSAFASNNAPYLIRSAQNELIEAATDATEANRLSEATSLRQASEWGMRAIQSAFPRLRDTMKYEEQGERRRILKLVPLLYNYRLEVVGLNQLRNTYVPNWSRDIDYFVSV